MRIKTQTDPWTDAAEMRLGDAYEEPNEEQLAVRLWVRRYGCRAYQKILRRRVAETFAAGGGFTQAAFGGEQANFAELDADGWEEMLGLVAAGMADEATDVAEHLVDRVVAVDADTGETFDVNGDAAAAALCDLFEADDSALAAVLYLAHQRERQYQDRLGMVKELASRSQVGETLSEANESESESV